MRKHRRSVWPFVLALAVVAVFLVLTQPDVLAPEPEGSSAGSAPGQGGWYEVRFTQPVYPDDPSRHQGSLDTSLVDLMDRATRTLDVAVYDFDLADVAEAMARAKARGVAVRMVTDTDTLQNTRDANVQSAFAKVKGAGIPIVADEREAIMHHKFTVVDGEWVETGSWNYTDGDTYRLNNNMVIIHSQELARNYTAEFERMFIHRQFGARKEQGTDRPVISIAGTEVENYFSPQDEVALHVVEVVKQAKESVFFMAYSFTHDDIGQAIVAQAQAGRKVAGVFETTGSNTTFSEYGRMKEAGLAVYQDGNPYSMHHKVIILDEKTVIFGSFNFSASADDANDENLLIVHDPRLAQAFKAEFDRVLATAKNPPPR
ncbi:MAG: phospholipase D-like domain-containing protein [Dehalococcoidales bacterium]|nr:phospholipase D-like domain-containing protein [Dehalococcoidales bacterium]